MWHISADELVAPMVSRFLPECGRSFTSPGFSLCLLSILYTVLCDICIVWAICDTVAPVAFIQMTCHRWLMVLFPMTNSTWPVTKSWLLGWPKLCWFQLYCSTTISLIFARHVTRYIHIILTIFQEATQCLTLWKISLKIFCKDFFPGVYIFILDLTSGFKRFGKESRKAARKSFKCWGLVRLILKTWQYPWFRAERSLSKSWIINYSFTVCKQSQLRPLHTNTHRENEIMSKSKKGKYKNELWTATGTRNSISFKDKLSSRSFTSRGSDNWKLHSQLIEVFLDIYAEYNSAC